MDGSLRTATVMLYDVVGSTRLRAQLGDAAAEQLFRNLDRDVSAAVDQHGGRVVKGTGDGQFVVFDSATMALVSAFAVRRAAGGLHIRMGISVGDVREDSADVYGGAAAEAARLCEEAQPGEVLVSDQVKVLAGSWHDLEFVDAGARRLRGMPSPMQTWFLDGGGHLAREPLLLVDEEFPFVGRAEELEILERVWRDAIGGGFGLAAIAGEPGAGKSRLAVHFSETLPADVVRIAGRCERQGGPRLAPILDALDSLFRSDVGPDAVSSGGQAQAVLARVLPALRDIGVTPAADLDDPSLEEFRIGQSVLDILAALSRRKPVLFVLDDAQWAGEAVRHLVSRLSRSLDGGRLMAVLTFRDTVDDLDADTGTWLHSMVRRRGGVVLSLGGLTVDDVRRLAVSALGRAASDTVAEELFLQSGGNGFFTSELLRQLVGGDPSSVPRSVSDLVIDRLGRLPADAGRVLEVAALMGLDFDAGIASAVAGLSGHDALSALRSAVGARLIIESGFETYQFAHALIPEALAERLGPTGRARTHAAIAEAFDARGSSLAAIAWHLVSAIPAVTAERARDAAVKAAEAAWSEMKFDDAAQLYGLALTVAESAPARCELLLRQAEAWNEYGSPSYAVPMFREAFELAARNEWWDSMARAALGIWGNDPWRANRSTEVLGLLERSAAHLDLLDPALAAEIVAQQASFSIFTERLAERAALADRALAMLGDEATLAGRHRVLSARWVALACPANLTAVEELDDVIEDVRRKLGRVVEYGAAAREVALAWRGDGPGFRRCRDELVAADHPTRDIDVWRFESLDSTIALAEGRIEAARSHADKARDFGIDAWNDTAVAIHAYAHFTADLLEGVPGRSRDAIGALAEVVGGHLVRLLGAWIDGEDGRTSQAAYVLERVGEGRLRVLPEFFLGTMGLAAAAGAALAVGEERWMRVVYDALTPLEEQICGIAWAPLPAAAHFLGMLARGLGEGDAAAHHFEVADRLHARFGAPGFDAYSRRIRET